MSIHRKVPSTPQREAVSPHSSPAVPSHLSQNSGSTVSVSSDGSATSETSEASASSCSGFGFEFSTRLRLDGVPTSSCKRQKPSIPPSRERDDVRKKCYATGELLIQFVGEPEALTLLATALHFLGSMPDSKLNTTLACYATAALFHMSYAMVFSAGLPLNGKHEGPLRQNDFIVASNTTHALAQAALMDLLEVTTAAARKSVEYIVCDFLSGTAHAA